jgi:hypothetical protein
MEMEIGQTFNYKGKLWKFEGSFQYKGSDRVLATARRWVKSKQHWSSSVLIVCLLKEAEDNKVN